MKDLCMDCKNYEDCPVLHWGWIGDIKKLYADSPLPRKPDIIVSITTCNEYEKSTYSALDQLIFSEMKR